MPDFTTTWTTIEGLKLSEWTAIVFGASGLAVSSITLLRGRSAERKAETNARRARLEQKVEEARALSIVAKTVSRATIRELKAVQRTARRQGESEMVQELDRMIVSQNRTLELVDISLLELSKDIPPPELWDQLETTIGASLAYLKQEFDADLAQEELADLINEFRENLELKAELRRLQAEQPAERASAASKRRTVGKKGAA